MVCRRAIALCTASVTLAAVMLSATVAFGWPRGGTHAPLSMALPIAVFGTDDRGPVPPQYRELQDRIGLLFNLRSRSACTAFCVAPDIVATAGHCLHRTAGEPSARLADFWFAPHYEARRGYARLAGSANGTVAQYVMSGALNLKIRPPIDATKDWALVRLSESICNKGVLPVRAMPTEQVIAEAAAGRVFQIAYHRDFTPWRLVYSKPCQVARSFPTADWATISLDFTEPGQLLLHTCDTGGASSGSPLLLATPTGPEVIGLNVGTYIQSKVEMERGKVVRRHKADTVANTGVSALAFATKLDVFRNAVIVTASHQIRTLQSALKQRGYYDGEINGTFSPALRASIETFERAHGLTVTGLATQALLKRLSAAAAGRTPARGPG